MPAMSFHGILRHSLSDIVFILWLPHIANIIGPISSTSSHADIGLVDFAVISIDDSI